MLKNVAYRPTVYKTGVKPNNRAQTIMTQQAFRIILGMLIASACAQFAFAKGQLISECLFDIVNFPKKQQKK